MRTDLGFERHRGGTGLVDALDRVVDRDDMVNESDLRAAVSKLALRECRSTALREIEQKLSSFPP